MNTYILVALLLICGTISHGQIKSDRFRGVRKAGTTAANTYPLLVAAVDGIDRMLPTLTPKEQDWVDFESKQLIIKHSPERWVNLQNSKEYNISEIRKCITEIKYHLSKLQEAGNANDHKTANFLWVSLSIHLQRNRIEESIQSYLNTKNIDPKNFHLPDSGIYIYNEKDVSVIWQLWGEAIWEGFAKNDLSKIMEVEIDGEASSKP
jgi:hypothetical protein